MDTQYKYLELTIEYVFRANFNDSYYLEKLYLDLEDLVKGDLVWIDPYHGRGRQNKTLIAVKSVSDEEYVLWEKTDGKIRETTAKIHTQYIFCEDFDSSMLIASHISFRKEKSRIY